MSFIIPHKHKNKKKIKEKCRFWGGLVLFLFVLLILGLLITSLPKTSENKRTTMAVYYDSIASDPAALNTRLLSSLETYSAADSSEKESLAADILKTSQMRKDSLLDLMEKNPAEFLKYAMSTEVRETFPPAVQNNLEKRVSLEGTLSVIIGENMDKQESNFLYYLAADGAKFSVYLTRQLDIPSGTQVKISGIMLGTKIVLNTDETDSIEPV